MSDKHSGESSERDEPGLDDSDQPDSDLTLDELEDKYGCQVAPPGFQLSMRIRASTLGDTWASTRPVPRLPVLRLSDGSDLQGKVTCREDGPILGAQDGDNSMPVLDLTRSHFEIVVEVDGRLFDGVGGWGWPTLEPIVRLMRKSGYLVGCCRTCMHFKPSHMVDEWSFGTEGYCVATGEPTMDNLTHMLHICNRWTARDEDCHCVN